MIFFHLIDSNAEYYVVVFSEEKPTLRGYRMIKETGLIAGISKIH